MKCRFRQILDYVALLVNSAYVLGGDAGLSTLGSQIPWFDVNHSLASILKMADW